MEKQKLGSILYIAGALMVLAATVVYVVTFDNMTLQKYVPWFFSAGVAIDIAGRVMTLPPLKNFRVRRLNNILALSSILLIASAYFMFIGKHYCIITILLSAIMDLWYSYRIKGALEDAKK